MAYRERICRFCFEKCDTNFKAIERSTHDILNILLVTVNLAISDKPMMCENCSEVLQKSFVFKKICLNIQDNTVAFEYAVKKGHALCRFCMNVLENRFFTILDIEDVSEKTMLEKYFPELMNLNTCKKPVICDVCHESLVIFLSFITISSIVEEKIKEYCESKSVHNPDSIKLNDVLQFTSENVWKVNDNKLEVFEMEDMVSVKRENEEIKIEEGKCILCLEIRDKFKAIDENTRNILDIILPKIDFTGEQEFVMCESCEEMLIKCHDFKTRCLQSFNYMVPFFNNTDDVKLNLKDVYLSKNVTCTDIPDDHNVCGFCMGLVKNGSAISLNVEEVAIMLERMIEECLPELDLSIIEKLVICVSCHGSLEDCFHFVMTHLIIREQIKKYCEIPDINSENKIELSSSLQFTARDIKREVDGNSTNIIKVENQFCEDNENLDEKEIGDERNTVKLEQMFIDDSEDANKDIEKKYENFMEINDEEVNNEHKYTPRNKLLSHTEESNKLGFIKIEDIVCEENETTLEKEENFVEMEDSNFLLKEEIEIKTDEHDFNRYEDGIVLPQSEATGMLHRREKFSVKNLERDQSKSDIKHTLTKKHISKIYSFQTKHKKSLVNHDLFLEGFKERLLAYNETAEVTMHKCDFCSFDTKNKNSFKRHMLKHKDHSEIIMYKCEFCYFQTKFKSSLKRHFLMHKDPSEVTMYECDFCSFQTKTKNYLNVHLLKHKDPSEVTMYTCDFCSFQTKTKKYLKSHLLLMHKDPSEVTMYKCDVCSFQTETKENLKSHLLKHKDPSELPIYKCDFCSFQTKSKKYLTCHSLKHMDPSEGTVHKCDFCSFQTKTKKCLIGHLLQHKDPSEITMYTCDICSFQTKTKNNLRSHLQKHKDPSEVKMYKCDCCSFETKFKSYLNTHLLQHKDPSEVTMYKCDFCFFQTKLKNSLKTHLLQHKDPSEVTMHKCDICSFQTKSKKYLKIHLMKHKDPSEVTMYKCDFCSFQTKLKNSLKTHLLRHRDPSEVTMYICRVCSFQTKIKNSLKGHLRKHKELSGVTV